MASNRFWGHKTFIGRINNSKEQLMCTPGSSFHCYLQLFPSVHIVHPITSWSQSFQTGNSLNFVTARKSSYPGIYTLDRCHVHCFWSYHLTPPLYDHKVHDISCIACRRGAATATISSCYQPAGRVAATAIISSCYQPTGGQDFMQQHPSVTWYLYHTEFI